MNGLFRGKRVDNGEWVIGYYVQKQDPLLAGVTYHCILTQEKDNCGCLMSTVSWYKVIPETVGQYTGLTDKNGTKIFEGDIVQGTIVSAWNKALIRCEVVYNKDGFISVERTRNQDRVHKVKFAKDIEVIGNIHDNPELLGE